MAKLKMTEKELNKLMLERFELNKQIRDLQTELRAWDNSLLKIE